MPISGSHQDIPADARQLKDLIFEAVGSRGVVLLERSFRIEQDLPVLRFQVEGVVLNGSRIRIPGGQNSPQTVITVSGSSDRWSRSWHRRRDETFDLAAVADYVVALVEHERAKPPPAELQVPCGLTPSSSGLHALHLAAIRLGVRPLASPPQELLDAVVNERTRSRIDRRLKADGVTEADLRVLADVAPLNLWRPNLMDFDPFEPSARETLPVALIGNTTASGIECRYVLVLDSGMSGVLLADPGGGGLVTLDRNSFLAAWKLGERRGRSWVALVYPVSTPPTAP